MCNTLDIISDCYQSFYISNLLVETFGVTGDQVTTQVAHDNYLSRRLDDVNIHKWSQELTFVEMIGIVTIFSALLSNACDLFIWTENPTWDLYFRCSVMKLEDVKIFIRFCSQGQKNCSVIWEMKLHSVLLGNVVLLLLLFVSFWRHAVLSYRRRRPEIKVGSVGFPQLVRVDIRSHIDDPFDACQNAYFQYDYLVQYFY